MKKKSNKIIMGVLIAAAVAIIAFIIIAASGGINYSVFGGENPVNLNEGTHDEGTQNAGTQNTGTQNTVGTIAQPITLSDYSVREDENSIQDPAAYFGNDMFKYEGSSYTFKLEGNGEETIAAFDSYISYIKNNVADVTVSAETNDNDPYPLGGYNWYLSEYNFAYTGEKTVTPLTSGSKDVINAQIYYKYGNSEIIICLSSDYIFRDLGYRYNAPKVAVTPSGESAGAGVIRKGNTFSTTDGRLSCELGNATILKSGSSFTSAVKYKNISGKNDTFLANGFNGDEAIGVKIPTEEAEKCDIYIKYDMDGTSVSRKYFSTVLPAETTEIYYSRNGETFWEYPNPNNPAVKDATLRVMYYDGEIAVYYVYIDVDEPIELFGAVSLKQEEPETQENNNGSSGNSGSNNSSWNDRNNNSVDFCSKCGNKGWYDCNDCVDGYNRVKINTPVYTEGVGGTTYEMIPCKSRGCNGGKIDCDRCDN